ncbi:MAG: cation transporter [Acidobacteria bacterium]|nr:cation transporter [Acidobacteriota bacterium]
MRHHRHRQLTPQRGLRIALVLTCAYMLVEALGGWWTNSLALMADAGHMFTDVGALVLALGAIWVSARKAPPAKTYGYYRTEILAAMINATVLILVSVGIILEAVQRIREPPAIASLGMLVVAAGGLGVNLVSYRLLRQPAEGGLNLRGAALHVIGDAIGSVGAILAAALIFWRGWMLADPLVSILTAGLIIFGAWTLLRDAVNVLLEATPRHIDVRQVEQAIRSVDGVSSVHDLHIWTITSGKEALSAHVILCEGACQKSALQEVCARLQREFGIDHLTIQTESHDFEEEEMRF